MKKSRLGSDPLSWIGKKEGKTNRSKQDKLSKLSKQSKQRIQDKPNLQTGRAKVIAKTSQKGLPEGWTRATFIMREDYLEKLKALAYWDRKQIEELMDEVVGFYLKDKKIRSLKK